MGHPKVAVEVGGHTMGSLVAAAVTQHIATVVTVGRHPIPGMTQLDDGDGMGPMAALTGLAAAWEDLGDPDGVYITAVDHPWLRTGTIAHLAERFATMPVVPMHQGVRQVLCAVYPRAFVLAATDQIHNIQSALDGTEVDDVAEDEWSTWGEDGRSWFSTDRIDDVATGLDRYGLPAGNRA